MPIASINGITIGFDLVGDAADTVLFLHGHPFDRSMWLPQHDAVRSSGWRALVPDLRGYGETTVVPGKTTFDVFADDLTALLDHLGIDSVAVVGLSMGGQIAMEL